jgi:hypothetical protein
LEHWNEASLDERQPRNIYVFDLKEMVTQMGRAPSIKRRWYAGERRFRRGRLIVRGLSASSTHSASPGKEVPTLDPNAQRWGVMVKTGQGISCQGNGEGTF